MEIDTSCVITTNTLLQKLLNETKEINKKIDRLERKVEEQKILFEKTSNSGAKIGTY